MALGVLQAYQMTIGAHFDGQGDNCPLISKEGSKSMVLPPILGV